jgi:hypothetical protein
MVVPRRNGRQSCRSKVVWLAYPVEYFTGWIIVKLEFGSRQGSMHTQAFCLQDKVAVIKVTQVRMPLIWIWDVLSLNVFQDTEYLE